MILVHTEDRDTTFQVEYDKVHYFAPKDFYYEKTAFDAEARVTDLGYFLAGPKELIEWKS